MDAIEVKDSEGPFKAFIVGRVNEVGNIYVGKKFEGCYAAVSVSNQVIATFIAEEKPDKVLTPQMLVPIVEKEFELDPSTTVTAIARKYKVARESVNKCMKFIDISKLPKPEPKQKKETESKQKKETESKFKEMPQPLWMQNVPRAIRLLEENPKLTAYALAQKLHCDKHTSAKTLNYIIKSGKDVKFFSV